MLVFHVHGYISEVFCGWIPRASKDRLVAHLLETGQGGKLPAWMKKRFPRYVSPESVKEAWYLDPCLMENLMKGCGFRWDSYHPFGKLAIPRCRSARQNCRVRGPSYSNSTSAVFHDEIAKKRGLQGICR